MKYSFQKMIYQVQRITGEPNKRRFTNVWMLYQRFQLAFVSGNVYFYSLNHTILKKKMIITCLLLTFTGMAYAQQADYRVVFDMSTRDSVSQQALVRELELIKKYNPAAKLEVVVYGQGLPMVLKNRTKYGDAIKRILEDKNTEFKVCAFTLQRFEVKEADLLPGVQVVNDGIYEIITKQREGWGYIKVAH